MGSHGDYYLRRSWVMNHHGHLSPVLPTNTSSMKYYACLHAAYRMTGETRFRDEAFRLVRALRDNGKLPWPGNPYEVNHNPFYYGFLSEYWLTTELANEMDWVSYIDRYWRAANSAIDERGLFQAGVYDEDTETFTPYENRWVDAAGRARLGVTDPNQSDRRWISPTSFPGRMTTSSLLAVLGLMARARGLDDSAHEVGRRTLASIDDDSLRWLVDDGTLPEELAPVTNMFAPEVPANWLVPYWMGREQGVW